MTDHRRTSRRWVAIALCFFATSVNGCLGAPQETTVANHPFQWGIGVPEQEELLNSTYEAAEGETESFDTLMDRFAAHIQCPRTDLTVHGIYSTTNFVLNACRPDELRGYMGTDPGNHSYDGRVESLEQRLARHFVNMSGMNRPAYPAIAELTSVVASRSVNALQTVELSRRMYQAYHETGRESALKTAVANLNRVEDRLVRQEAFMEVIIETQTLCPFDREAALDGLQASLGRIETTLAHLKATGEIKPGRGGYIENASIPVAQRTLSDEIALAADVERLQVEFYDAHEKTATAKRLPTRGEAIYLYNQLIEAQPRPGIREHLLIEAPLSERWGHDGTYARRGLAMTEVDWRDHAPPEC